MIVKNKPHKLLAGWIICVIPVLISCESPIKIKPSIAQMQLNGQGQTKIEIENYLRTSTNADVIFIDTSSSYVHLGETGWVEFEVNIPASGIYNISLSVSPNSPNPTNLWIEDATDEANHQPHNITGKITVQETMGTFSTIDIFGAPLRSGNHLMKMYTDQCIDIDWVSFDLSHTNKRTPLLLRQGTEGTQWSLVWADEFDSNSIDSTNWSYEVGDWGWGENDKQYYTRCRTENARIENGKLIIEARKNDMGKAWTSARLSTRGKVSFLYGKYEIRAKIPVEDGTRASVWTQGDHYVDEGSKPQCGEISILECHGSEIDDQTGDGTVHASKHMGSDYFNLEGQHNGWTAVSNMNSEFHTYSVEWLPNKIMEYVDDKLYAVYDQSSTDLSWPDDNPQNIIMELAIGGHSGDATEVANIESTMLVIDYVRVYELR
jgi:beta-glucanase (GH16 family)